MLVKIEGRKKAFEYLTKNMKRVLHESQLKWAWSDFKTKTYQRRDNKMISP